MVLILVLSVGVSDEQHLSTVYGIQIYRSITDVPISVYRQIDGSLNPAPQVTYRTHFNTHVLPISSCSRVDYISNISLEVA